MSARALASVGTERSVVGDVLEKGGDWFARHPCIDMIGSRKASSLGVRRARVIARSLVEHDIVVVSGLAAGVDRAAHEAAIASGGQTIAVVGTPLDRCYPNENSELQRRIAREQLLIWNDPSSVKCGTSASFVFGEAEQTAAEAC